MDPDYELDPEVAGTELDIEGLLRALDARREALGLSWRKVEFQLGIEHTSFVRYRHGDVPNLVSYFKMIRWLRLPPDTFVAQPSGAKFVSHNDHGFRRESETIPLFGPRTESEPDDAPPRGEPAGNDRDLDQTLEQIRTVLARIEAAITTDRTPPADRVADLRPDRPVDVDPHNLRGDELAEFLYACLIRMLASRSMQSAIGAVADGSGRSAYIARYAKNAAESLTNAITQHKGPIAVSRDEWATAALAVFPLLREDVPRQAVGILADSRNEGDRRIIIDVGNGLLSWLGSDKLIPDTRA